MIGKHGLNIIVRFFKKFIVPISIMKGSNRLFVLAIVEVVIWILLFPDEFFLFSLIFFL